MATNSARSQTDFDVLKSSQRGKVVAIVGALATLAGLYFVTRGGPIGDAERADSVLLIRSGTLSQRHVLREYGFKIAEAEFAEAEERAHQELPDFEGEGVAAILQLADLKGYGYVAFEHPSSYNFDDIDLAEVPEGLDAARWAVVSVGDFGFPHKMTLPPDSQRALKGYELDLLEALFLQDVLANVRDEEATKPQQIFALRTTLQGALERLDDIDLAVETIAKIHANSRKQLVDEEQLEPVPVSLGTYEESVKPSALADGGILTIRRKASFASYTGVTADVDLERTFEFLYSPPGKFDPEQRVVCTSLAGGKLEQQGARPRFRMAEAGDALLVDDGHDPHLWRLDPSGACTFNDLGSVAFDVGGRDNLGAPHSSGAVARVRSDGHGGATIEVVAVGQPAETLFETSSLALGQPVWIDARHLAVRARPEGTRATGILIISRDQPERQLWIDPAMPGIDHATITELTTLPGTPTRFAAIVESDSAPRQLVRIDLTGELKTRFEGLPPVATAIPTVPPPEPADTLEDGALADETPEPQPSLDPKIAIVPATEVSHTRLYEAHGVSAPVASPDGKRVAFLVYGQGSGTEIATATSDASAPAVVLTGNELDDHTPTFTTDGQHVVFHTRYKLRNTTWTLTAGRVVPVR